MNRFLSVNIFNYVKYVSILHMGPRKAVRIRTYGNLMTSSLINLILYNSSNHSSRQSLSIAAVAADLVTYIVNYGSAPPQTGAGLAAARDQIQLG